jgi:hypothetical protein
MRPACGRCRLTVSLSCFLGSDSCRRRATHGAPRWSSLRLARVRSSSAAMWPFRSASSTSRIPQASCGCARSTRSWSGSRTRTSHGDPALSKAAALGDRYARRAANPVVRLLHLLQSDGEALHDASKARMADLPVRVATLTRTARPSGGQFRLPLTRSKRRISARKFGRDSRRYLYAVLRCMSTKGTGLLWGQL